MHRAHKVVPLSHTDASQWIHTNCAVTLSTQLRLAWNVQTRYRRTHISDTGTNALILCYRDKCTHAVTKEAKPQRALHVIDKANRQEKKKKRNHCLIIEHVRSNGVVCIQEHVTEDCRRLWRIVHGLKHQSPGNIKYKFMCAAQSDPLWRIQQLLPQKRLLAPPQHQKDCCHYKAPLWLTSLPKGDYHMTPALLW